MKKSTKSSLIVFCVTFIVAMVMVGLVPDEMLRYTELSGLLGTISFFGMKITQLIGVRTILALAIALTVMLLVRIVDTDEEKSKKKLNKTAKNIKKQVAEWEILR